MAGIYTEISVVAPPSAQAGDTVNVEARIKNLYDFNINMNPSGQVGPTPLWFGSTPKDAAPGETLSWYDSFIMPDEDVLVSVHSWYLGIDGEWHPDDHVEVVVTFKELAPAGCLPVVLGVAVLATFVALAVAGVLF